MSSQDSRTWMVVGVVGAVAVVGLLGVGGLGYLVWKQVAREPAYAPAPVETAQEKYRAASDVFSVEPKAAAAQEDDAGILRLIETLCKAHREGRGQDFVKDLHFRRMLGEVEGGGAKIAELKTRKDEEEFLRGLSIGMARSISQISSTPDFGWRKVRLLRVRYASDRPEAEAFCRIRNGAGITLKVRFWLIQEEGRWWVYDWEMLDEGMRISTAVGGTIMAMQGGDAQRFQDIQRAGDLIRQGTALIAGGDPGNAVQRFRDARALRLPDAILSQVDLLEAVCLSQIGAMEEALAALEGGLRRQPDMPVAHHLRGGIYFEQGRYEECIRSEEEYLGMLGEDPEAYVNIGASLAALDRAEEAVAAYEKGIAADEDDFDNRYNLAALYLEQGEDEKVVPLFVAAFRNAPDPKHYFTSAATALQQSDANDALYGLSGEFLVHHPDDPDALYFQGMSLVNLGRHDEALATLESGMQRDKPDQKPFYWVQMAYALAHLGRTQEALDYAGRVDDAPPSVDHADYVRAYVYAVAEQTEDAAAALVRLWEAQPSYAYVVEPDPLFAAVLEHPGCRDALDRAKTAVETAEDPE